MPLEAHEKVFQDEAKVRKWNRAGKASDPPYHQKPNPDLVPRRQQELAPEMTTREFAGRLGGC